MQEYLRLIADGSLDVKSMVAAVYPVDQVDAAYGALKSGADKPLMVLLSYPQRAGALQRRMHLRPQSPPRHGKGPIRIALIGAGGFAKGAHLPNLEALSDDFTLRAVASRTGHNAVATGNRFSADYCTTDYQEVLNDPEVDAVIIATRHDTHASLALDALRAGKHVLLEKPTALTPGELLAIESFFLEMQGPTPVLLTGFNRRFSPYAKLIATLVDGRSNPMVINYRMNAGYIPLDHWVHGPEGGGRNRGEACHIYDLFTFLTGAAVTSVHATAMVPSTNYYSATDNFVATMGFEDGSVATLTYTALGNTEFRKESMEVFVDGKVIALDDYRRLTATGTRQQPMETRAASKGQKEELKAFAAAIRGEAEWPIPLWQQLQATRISFEVDRFLA